MGHVHTYLEEIGQGIQVWLGVDTFFTRVSATSVCIVVRLQHLANRTENLVALVQRANDIR